MTMTRQYTVDQKADLLNLAVVLKKLSADGVISVTRDDPVDDNTCKLSQGLAELLNQIWVDAEMTRSRFDEFWAVWPKCRRDAKKQAMAVWKKNKLDRIADRIIEDVQARIDSGRWGDDPQYILLPTTYLRGERWNDASSVIPVAAHQHDGVRLSKAVPVSRKPKQAQPSVRCLSGEVTL
jgi:hypothetical protein